MQVVYRLNTYIPNSLLIVSHVCMHAISCISIVAGYTSTGLVKTSLLEKMTFILYLSNLYAILMVVLIYNLDLPFFIGFQILVIATQGLFLKPPFNDYCRFTSFTLTLIYVSFLLLKVENPIFGYALFIFFALWIAVQIEIWWKRFGRNVNEN